MRSVSPDNPGMAYGQNTVDDSRYAPLLRVTDLTRASGNPTRRRRRHRHRRLQRVVAREGGGATRKRRRHGGQSAHRKKAAVEAGQSHLECLLRHVQPVARGFEEVAGNPRAVPRAQARGRARARLGGVHQLMTASMVHVTGCMVHVTGSIVHVTAGMVRVTNLTPGSECAPTACTATRRRRSASG
jgi:hypothetical protein